MSNRGKRYDNEAKLNYKKVIGVIVAIAVIVMIIIVLLLILCERKNCFYCNIWGINKAEVILY